MNALIYLVLFFQQHQPQFTGNIVYAFSGWDLAIDTTEFVIGEDFYIKREAGDFFKTMQGSGLFKESINDLANNQIYHIYPSRVEEWESSRQSQAELSDIVVGDTVEYLGLSMPDN